MTGYVLLTSTSPLAAGLALEGGLNGVQTPYNVGKYLRDLLQAKTVGSVMVGAAEGGRKVLMSTRGYQHYLASGTVQSDNPPVYVADGTVDILAHLTTQYRYDHQFMDDFRRRRIPCRITPQRTIPSLWYIPITNPKYFVWNGATR